MGGLFVNAAKKNGGTPIRFKFLAVLRPFFTSVNQDRNKAWGWLGLMLALLVLESGVLVTFSYTQVRAMVPPLCAVLAARSASRKLRLRTRDVDMM